jgi:very-short-patch-repair endonuclease
VWILGDSAPAVVFGPPQARIDAIAELQRARVGRQQLLIAGVSGSAIDRRIRNGTLTAVHHGVYRVGPDIEIELADETAAVLATFPHSFLSDHSAATLYGIRAGRARPIHVTVPFSSQTGNPDGVIVHRSRILTPRDVRIVECLPVTSPARALLDIAPKLSHRELVLAVEQARKLKLVSEADLHDTLRRAGQHRGRCNLDRAVAAPAHSLTESQAEEAFWALIQDAELPVPETQRTVLGYRVDFLWPEHRVIVEIDGAQWHDTPGAFGSDRRRDARLTGAGYIVLRFTAIRVEHGARAVLVEVARVLTRTEGAVG